MAQARISPDGERIRDLRLARGMTQEKLARMANVDIKTIYRAERGEAAMRPETLLDIATSLDAPIDALRAAPAEPDADEEPSDKAPEGHGNLLLRRVERAASYYRMATGCEHYSWSFNVDPDEATAAAMRELMEITKRATLGPEPAADEFDREGEFSEPARVARLKRLLEELRERNVSVLANRFVHVIGRDEGGGSATAVVLRILFVEGDVERRREFADFDVPAGARASESGARGRAPEAAATGKETRMIRRASRLIEGVGPLSFESRGNSVMGALELALATMGDPTHYDALMGASGAAFRLQMALPEWCPSAPYAGVGRDCIPAAADAIGRRIEWIPADPSAPHPMQRRIEAIVETIDRGAPALYGAEECGLVVGYHNGGEKLSLRTYFDPTEVYAVLDRMDWPSPGIIGAERRETSPAETLRSALERARELAEEQQTFPSHRPGHFYACGFAAWDAWIDGLRDDEAFAALRSLARPIQANAWCYSSLVDARAAGSRYLLGHATKPPVADAALGDHLRQASALYAEQVGELEKCRASVPLPGIVAAGDDPNAVGYRPTDGAWPREARLAQADALERALALERRALDELAAAHARL